MATNNKINGIPAPLDSDVLDSADLRGIAQGVADNKTNISLLGDQINGPPSRKNFDCNIRTTKFIFVSLYQGVNAPTQNAAVLLHLPYSSDWIKQIFYDIAAGVNYERQFKEGTTWTPWVAK